MLTDGELRERLAGLVAEATDGEVEAAEVLAGTARLADLGVTSLGFLRLIDAVETEFGVEVDPGAFETLDDLVRDVRAREPR
ncbi:acyl carrier protein [Nonomuraea rhodomycinica]|uniref:Acyl carrier protein n=1 Tax=Nonomuraea rhodomycinica TaxID=1712872 RepID=A0A7Y6INU6_9ACTN|nr:acyl carrier protein [Nonomuraea rhodomycinica]NUW41376.1 acyl carrier protein [Nonomuraea rhodomycinica]